jgi:hypothetical protein
VRAQLVGTALVFFATWVLHAYQYYWLTGSMLLSGPDIAFWSILGSWVVVNLAVEIRARNKGPVPAPGRVVVALKTAATFSAIVVLWSMWNSPTLAGWVDLLTYWEVG